MFNGQSLDRIIDLTQQRLLLGLRLLLQRGQAEAGAGVGAGTGGDRWDTVGHHVHHLPQTHTHTHTRLKVDSVCQYKEL